MKSSVNMCYQQGPSAPDAWELSKPSSGPCSNVESVLKTWPKPLLRHLQPETAPLRRAPQLLLTVCMIKALRRCEGPIAASLVLPHQSQLGPPGPSISVFSSSTHWPSQLPRIEWCWVCQGSEFRSPALDRKPGGHSGASPVGKG